MRKPRKAAFDPADPAAAQAFMEKALKGFFPEVGRIAAVWGMLEWRMDTLIWDLAGVEQRLGACITSQLNGHAPRIRTITALAAMLEVPEAVLKKIRTFGNTLREPQEERNRIIHDAWFVGMLDKSVNKMTVAMGSKKLTFEQRPVTVDSLRETLRKSQAHLQEFNVLQQEIRRSVPAMNDELTRKLFHRLSPLDERKIGPNNRGR
jgi:hypothetical protein